MRSFSTSFLHSSSSSLRSFVGCYVRKGVFGPKWSVVNKEPPGFGCSSFGQTRRLQSSKAQLPLNALDLFSMSGKVCFVTGAARGLGHEFCRAFVEAGCTSLAILDLQEEEAKLAAEELTLSMVDNRITQAGHLDVIGIGCDVAQSQSVQDAYRIAIQRWGKVDVVVAAAGIAENFSAFEYPEDRYKQLFDINTHGVFHTAKEGAKWMVEKGNGGSIVLVSSMSAGIVNVPQPQAPYNASKAAVRHFASSLAVEWAKHGIRVNSLSPGYMHTRLTKGTLEEDKDLKTTWESLTPLRRIGNPEDLKGAILFLSSDASKFMTGTDVLVDGGYSAI